jgi:hypothetical protein
MGVSAQTRRSEQTRIYGEPLISAEEVHLSTRPSRAALSVSGLSNGPEGGEPNARALQRDPARTYGTARRREAKDVLSSRVRTRSKV